MYHLNFSPKGTGLVIFFLGGGVNLCPILIGTPCTTSGHSGAFDLVLRLGTIGWDVGLCCCHYPCHDLCCLEFVLVAVCMPCVALCAPGEVLSACTNLLSDPGVSLKQATVGGESPVSVTGCAEAPVWGSLQGVTAR